MRNQLVLVFIISIISFALICRATSKKYKRKDYTNVVNFEQNRLRYGLVKNNLLPEAPHCGLVKRKRDTSRILGGIKTKWLRFPWMVNISVGCGGTLINSRWVLTAAHCFLKSNFKTKKVVVHLHRDTGFNELPAEKVIIHEKFVANLTAFYNDVALIQLKHSVKFTKEVQPICLPYDNQAINNNIIHKRAIISGWGSTEHQNSSKTIMYTKVRIWNTDRCEKVNVILTQVLNSKYQICAGGLKGVDACKGDSGGPLIMLLPRDRNHKTRYFYQLGIISFGFKCGLRGYPGVYTNLSTYLPWIREKVLANN